MTLSLILAVQPGYSCFELGRSIVPYLTAALKLFLPQMRYTIDFFLNSPGSANDFVTP